MNEELIEFLVRNLFTAVISAFILSWIISFILNKDMYQELKKRIRTVFSVIIFILLFFIEISPFESEAREMMKEWYPDAKEITIITIEKSKTKKNTYDGYVQWEYNNKNCKGVLLITKEKKTSGSWWYELPEESISCQ